MLGLDNVMSDFKVVSYKRKKHRPSNVNLNQGQNINIVEVEQQLCSSSRENIIKRILSAKEDIYSSKFYEKCIDTFNKEKRALDNIDIVSYGLGQFSHCVNARYQFAFLLLIKDHYKGKVFIYDPIFTRAEIEIAKHFDCTVIDFNEEGKRQVIHSTIFFLPHCSKQLTNNLLWKNWSKYLSNCIIIGNSFEKIIEFNSDKYLEENLYFLFHASSFVTELKFDNCFKFPDIFNDLSYHFFTEENIENWTEKKIYSIKEPSYQESDIEFITQSIPSSLKIS